MNDELRMLLVKHLKDATLTKTQISDLLEQSDSRTFTITKEILRIDMYKIMDEIFNGNITGLYRATGSSCSVFHIEDIIAIVTDKEIINKHKILGLKYAIAKEKLKSQLKTVPQEVLDYVKQFKVGKRY